VVGAPPASTPLALLSLVLAAGARPFRRRRSRR